MTEVVTGRALVRDGDVEPRHHILHARHHAVPAGLAVAVRRQRRRSARDIGRVRRCVGITSLDCTAARHAAVQKKRVRIYRGRRLAQLCVRHRHEHITQSRTRRLRHDRDRGRRESRSGESSQHATSHVSRHPHRLFVGRTTATRNVGLLSSTCRSDVAEYASCAWCASLMLRHRASRRSPVQNDPSASCAVCALRHRCRVSRVVAIRKASLHWRDTSEDTASEFLQRSCGSMTSTSCRRGPGINASLLDTRTPWRTDDAGDLCRARIAGHRRYALRDDVSRGLDRDARERCSPTSAAHSALVSQDELPHVPPVPVVRPESTGRTCMLS